MQRGRSARLALFVAVFTAPALADVERDVGAPAPKADSFRREPNSIGIGLLAGLGLPRCSGQSEACESSLGAAPSLRGFALYQPSPSFGVGIVGQLARLQWRTTYPAYEGPPGVIESNLTTGFAGLIVRWDILPWARVTPVIDVALGSAFQGQTGRHFSCNDGLIPTAQAGLGATARVSSSFSLVARAGASGGLKGECEVSDGPPTVPFVAWGYDFHLGATFDVGLR